MLIDINIDGVKTTRLIEMLYREGIWDKTLASYMSQHHITGAWINLLVPKTPDFRCTYPLHPSYHLSGFYLGIEFTMNKYKWLTQTIVCSRRITADACNHILQEVLE